MTFPITLCGPQKDLPAAFKVGAGLCLWFFFK